MYNAVHGGHLDIVKYLDALHVVDVAPNMMKEAAVNGHLHIVKWLCERYQHQFTYLFPSFYSSEADDGYSRQTAMDKAATNGHFDVLKFLHSLAETMKVEGKTGYPVCSGWAFSTAAVYGHLEIVKWLFQHFPEQCRSRYTTNMAARSGRLEILKWLHGHTDVVWTTSAMNEAAEKGHLSVVKWLHENRKEGCATYAMDHAAHYGHLDVVRFLHYNRREGCSERAMDLAARERHFEILLFLRAKRTEGCTMGAILATQGHLSFHSIIGSLRDAASYKPLDHIQSPICRCFFECVIRSSIVPVLKDPLQNLHVTSSSSIVQSWRWQILVGLAYDIQQPVNRCHVTLPNCCTHHPARYPVILWYIFVKPTCYDWETCFDRNRNVAIRPASLASENKVSRLGFLNLLTLVL